MDALTFARWQFGITTVYHFLFVPLTIGLAPLVAGFETAWVRTGDVKYLRATKFWGKLFCQGWTYWVFRRRIGTQHIPTLAPEPARPGAAG